LYHNVKDLNLIFCSSFDANEITQVSKREMNLFSSSPLQHL